MTSWTMAGTRSDGRSTPPRVEEQRDDREQTGRHQAEAGQPAHQRRIADGAAERQLEGGGDQQQHRRKRQPRADEPAAHGGERDQDDAQRDGGDERQLHRGDGVR